MGANEGESEGARVRGWGGARELWKAGELVIGTVLLDVLVAIHKVGVREGSILGACDSNLEEVG